jgi:hypothetical protein
MTSPSWHNDWEQFGSTFNLSQVAIGWLRSQAEVPIDLLFLPWSEVVSKLETLTVPRATSFRALRGFDDWNAVFRVVNVSDESKKAFVDAFDAPSDLVFKEFDDNTDLKLKRCTFEKVKAFAQRQFEAMSVQSGGADHAPASFCPHALNGVGFVGLSSVMSSNSIVVTRIHIMDEVVARISGGQTIDDVLSPLSGKNSDWVTGMRFPLGFISDISAMVTYIDKFPKCTWIDLHVNRIDASQFENVRRLAVVLSERNGVLVIYGNSVVSTETAKQMSEWAKLATATSEDGVQARNALLHLIWMPGNRVGAREGWSRMLSNFDDTAPVEPKLLTDIATAHNVYFSWARQHDFD